MVSRELLRKRARERDTLLGGYCDVTVLDPGLELGAWAEAPGWKCTVHNSIIEDHCSNVKEFRGQKSI